MTHNAATSLSEVWRHCLAHGHTEARFRQARGLPQTGVLHEGVGRLGVLSRRLLQGGTDVGIGAARLPFAFAFYAAFTATLAVGLLFGARYGLRRLGGGASETGLWDLKCRAAFLQGLLASW